MGFISVSLAFFFYWVYMETAAGRRGCPDDGGVACRLFTTVVGPLQMGIFSRQALHFAHVGVGFPPPVWITDVILRSVEARG